MRFDAVLLQAGVHTELMGGILEDLVEPHSQLVARLPMDHIPLLDPVTIGILSHLLIAATGGRQRARRAHPVQGLVTATIGMDEDAAIGFDDQQPRGERKMGGEPTGVVD
ncbi:hypothetical protein GCM10023160_20110 [Brachybacterium paraconglomeratum]